jgi:2-keto-4-pentenoate hydratase/2-oxohepta-3-ene-1,7-dioic acid hydratase in catechol pathway
MVDPATGLAVLGPDEELPWPAKGDLEMTMEVACVIRGTGSELSLSQAEQAIFGYTLLVDWHVSNGVERSGGRRAGRNTRGRRHPREGFVALSFGPCVVTADEFDVDRAAVNVRIDRRTLSRGSVVGVKSAFARVVRAASREQELRPGDLLGSGSEPGGRAQWDVHPGAVVEVEAERIGVLRTRVGKRARSLASRK